MPIDDLVEVCNGATSLISVHYTKGVRYENNYIYR